MKKYKVTEEQLVDLTNLLGLLVEAQGIAKAKYIALSCAVIDQFEEIKEEEKGDAEDGTE